MKGILTGLLALSTVAAFAFDGVPGPRDLTARASIIVEADTGREVWSRNADSRMYPASTTKMMTLLLLLENTFPTDRIYARAGVDKVKGSSLHLKPGESLTSIDLAYGLMLRSANDACETVAMHISGSIPDFAAKMNERAKLIGCTSTHFNNPHGMPDPLHKTTARDLSIIAREGLKNPTFKQIVGTASYVVHRSINQRDTLIKSRNELLGKDPTIKGVKTGFTNDAGRCFVGYREVGTQRFITVVMGCKDWVKDQIVLDKWMDQEFEERQVLDSTQIFESPVANGNTAVVKGDCKEPQFAVLDKQNGPVEFTYQPVKNLTAPVKVGDKIGQAIGKTLSGRAVRINIFATENVDAKVPLGSGIFPPLIAGFALLSVGGGGIVMIRRAAEKKRTSSRKQKNERNSDIRWN